MPTPEADAPPASGADPSPVASGRDGRSHRRRKRRPMRRRTKWILAVAITLALILGAVFGISWQAGQSLLHPNRATSVLTPGDLNLTWEWANFTTADNVAIVGWWIPAAAHATDLPNGTSTGGATGRVNGTVIFLHGYSESKAQGLPLAPFLHNASYNVLLFDFRAHGESGGAYTTAGLREKQEVDAALAWTRNKTAEGHNRTFLLGWSMGAAAALNAAANHPELGGIIAESSFSKLQNIVDTSISEFTGLPRWPFGPLAVHFASASVGIDISENAPARAVAAYKGPLLLIQGLNDTTVTPQQVDEIAAAAPHAQVWKVPGGDHTQCYQADPVRYRETVLAFLATTPPARPSTTPPTPTSATPSTA